MRSCGGSFGGWKDDRNSYSFFTDWKIQKRWCGHVVLRYLKNAARREIAEDHWELVLEGESDAEYIGVILRAGIKYESCHYEVRWQGFQRL